MIFLAKKYRSVILAIFMICQYVAIQLPAGQAINTQNDFVIKPYLQLGNHPLPSKEEKLELLWASDNNHDQWQLEAKEQEDSSWRHQKSPNNIVLSYSVPDKIYLYDNSIENLEPGKYFEYRLSRNGQVVFSGKGISRKDNSQSYRFALFGDTGANTASEKKIVYQTYEHKPDFLVIAGDIVYNFGCLSEYLEKFFPVFSSNKATPELGAPLLQSVPAFAVIGNHDIGYGANKCGVDFTKLRDALAYYQVWSEPLNGPLKKQSGPNIPKLLGSDDEIKKYLESAGTRYPQMSNYSFDYGNSHWLVLDANPYMDWTNQKLRNWVRSDLKAARGQTWKFVCFHQPGFSIDTAHHNEQRMRLLCDIFQDCNVDLVFSGHAHNYQRSYPLVFHAPIKNGIPVMNSDGTVSGDFMLDKKFDGVKETSPSGTIYIVSGGGGASLYGAFNTHRIGKKAVADSTTAQRIFTDKFISSTHSFSLCDVVDNKLTVKQISEDGQILDTFLVEKDGIRK